MPKKNDRAASVGDNVHFLHPVNGERRCVLRDRPKHVADDSVTYIPPDTPVGKALLGLKEGETGVVIAGNGDEYTITVTKVASRRAAA